MKMLSRFIFFITLSATVNLSAYSAEMESDVDLTLTADTGYTSAEIRERDDAGDHWYLSGDARLEYTLTGRGEGVRGQARMSVLGSLAEGTILELSRAYIRTKVPLGASYSLQLELGKNSLTWGEGSYYNAGDVIFGADPKEANLSTVGGFRDFSFWQLRCFVPINSFSYFEVVAGIPDQKYILLPSDNGSSAESGDTSGNLAIYTPMSDIEEAGAGARIHLETGPLQWETGTYSQYVAQRISPYVSVALPLVVRLYVASGMDIDYDEEADAFTEQYENVKYSAGVLYTRGLGRSAQLTLQAEVLQQNYINSVQLDSSLFFNRVLGALLRFNSKIEYEEYTITTGPQWRLEDGFSASIFSTTSINIDDDTDTNTLASGATLAFQYVY